MPKTIQIFEPPMCCSTGACGPQPSPELVRFATDIEWLKQHDVTIQRFNLTSHPQAFVETLCVSEALQTSGNACLPLFMVDGIEVRRGSYPSRQQMSAWAGVTPSNAGTATGSAPAACCGPGCC